MADLRHPTRIPKYSEGFSYYPREIFESSDNILKIVNDNVKEQYLNRFKNSPKIPCSLTPSTPPLTSKYPKFVISTLLPPGAISKSTSYNPNIPKIAPKTTKNDVIWPGDNLVFS